MEYTLLYIVECSLEPIFNLTIESADLASILPSFM